VSQYGLAVEVPFAAAGATHLLRSRAEHAGEMHGRRGNAVLGELDASGLEIEMPRVSALPTWMARRPGPGGAARLPGPDFRSFRP
jgi:hypothetical protein